MRSILIIPALNPDRKLLELIREVQLMIPKLHTVVVDDGSSEESAVIFEELNFLQNCVVCRHPENYGKGAALKTGISYSLQHYPGCNGFITADADGQHRTEDILQVATALEQYPDRVILGTRDFLNPSVPLKSRWGNMITAGIFGLLTGISCVDTQTGLRGIPVRYARLALEVEGERYEYETHFLLRAADEQIPFMEVEIETVYLDQNRGSHFRPLRDAARIYGMIIKYSFGNMFRFNRPGVSVRGRL